MKTNDTQTVRQPQRTAIPKGDLTYLNRNRNTIKQAVEVRNMKGDNVSDNELGKIIAHHLDRNESENELSQEVVKYKNEIDNMDNQAIVEYGSDVQNNLSKFSKEIMSEKGKDKVKPIHNELDELARTINDTDPQELLKDDERGLFSKIIRNPKRSMNKVFDKLTTNKAKIENIEKMLKKNNQVIKRDIENLDKLFDINNQYYDDITHLIKAGNIKINELKQDVLPELQARVDESDGYQEKQQLADMEDFINRLEKRVYDLELSKEVVSQTAPTIRMIQNMNQSLFEKIQSGINTNIPLWTNQMNIALSITDSQRLAKQSEQITDTTNRLLQNNAEMLNQNATVIAYQNEESQIDIDVLHETRDKIKKTVQDVLTIQEEGRQKRQKERQKLETLSNQNDDNFDSEREQLDTKMNGQ